MPTPMGGLAWYPGITAAFDPDTAIPSILPAMAGDARADKVEAEPLGDMLAAAPAARF